MSTDLAVIEAALKAATPAPWQADNNDVWTADGDRFISAPVRIADANLIANAPTWLAELVERVKVAEAAIERVRSEVLTKERDRRAELWRERNALAERCSELDTEVHLMRARIRRLEGGPDA